MEANDNVLRFEESLNDVINKTVVYGARTEALLLYQVTASTLPSHALFEATLSLDAINDVIRLAGSVSRINAYGEQSQCVEGADLKKFCYCKERG